jgi:hypothetical protein
LWQLSQISRFDKFRALKKARPSFRGRARFSINPTRRKTNDYFSFFYATRSTNNQGGGATMSAPKRRTTKRASDISFGRLMATLRRWDKVLAHRIICCDITKDFTAGFVLSRLMYWFGDGEDGTPRAQVERNGHLWVARTYLQWFAECRLTEAEIIAAYAVLEKMGLIERNVWKFAGNPTVHIRIVEENFMECWNAALDQTPPDDSGPFNRDAWKAYFEEWNAHKKAEAARLKAEKAARTATNKARKAARAAGATRQENAAIEDLVSRKFQETKPGNSRNRKPEIPELENPNFRESLTMDTAAGSPLDSALGSKKGVDFSNQQQQGADGVAVVAVLSSKSSLPKAKPEKPKTSKAVAPATKPKTQDPTHPLLPGLIVEVKSEPKPKTPGAETAPIGSTPLLQNLLALEAQNALAPVIQKTTAQLGLTWPEITAQLVELMPERELSPAQLIERLNQDFEAAGLDEQVSKRRAVQEVEKNASAVAWHLAIWPARGEVIGSGYYTLTARFLTKLKDDESLTRAQLETLLAPIRAKNAARIVAQRTEKQQRETEAQERAEAETEAREQRKQSRRERALDALIARMDEEEREDYRSESAANVPEHLTDRRNQRPGNAEAQAAIERWIIEDMRNILAIEKMHELNQLIDEMEAEEESGAETQIALAA